MVRKGIGKIKGYESEHFIPYILFISSNTVVELQKKNIFKRVNLKKKEKHVPNAFDASHSYLLKTCKRVDARARVFLS